MIWNYRLHVHEKSAKETFSKWSRRGENESESAKNKKKHEEIYVSSFSRSATWAVCAQNTSEILAVIISKENTIITFITGLCSNEKP